MNTNAGVGSVFVIDFWVWDSKTPPLNATTTRTVTIVNPCQDPDLPFQCEGNFHAHRCAEMFVPACSVLAL